MQLFIHSPFSLSPPQLLLCSINKDNIPYTQTLQDIRDIIGKRDEELFNSQELLQTCALESSCEEESKESKGEDDKDEIGDVRVLEELLCWPPEVLYESRKIFHQRRLRNMDCRGS